MPHIRIRTTRKSGPSPRRGVETVIRAYAPSHKAWTAYVRERFRVAKRYSSTQEAEHAKLTFATGILYTGLNIDVWPWTKR